MLFPAAPPQLTLALEKIHAVDQAVLRTVVIRAPETQQIGVLIDRYASVQSAQALRRFDVEDQQSAGTDKETETTEHLVQILRREVVDAVERAYGRVDRTVEIQLLRALTQEKRRGGEVRGFFARFHQHFLRTVHGDHLISAARELRRQRSRPAAEVEQKAELAAVAREFRLVIIRKAAVGNVARQRVIPRRKRPVAVHVFSSPSSARREKAIS